MSKKSDTVHLLIADPSQNDAEKVVSLLRNSGKATRVQLVNNEDDIQESLKSGTWELFVVREGHPQVKAEDVLAELKKLEKDIPCIVLNDELDDDIIVKYMRLGAKDVIPFKHTKHLVLAINRELDGLESRRTKRSMLRTLKDAEKRCELLLDSSKDAIAYVNDGMHVYANSSYMDFYGYDDFDDLMCIPVLDTLSSASQAGFKEATREFTQNNMDSRQISSIACLSDDTEVKVTMTLSSATYDGEECMQLVIRPEENSAELEEKLRDISSKDLLTGLYNRNYLVDQIEKSAKLAESGTVTSAVFYIALDNFRQIRSNVGIAGADMVISDIAHTIEKICNDQQVLGRISDDTYGILFNQCDEQTALDHAEKIRKAVEDHLSDVSGRTIQVTCSIGIAMINETAPSAQDLLGRAHTASDQVRKQEDFENGNGVLVYKPKAAEHVDEDTSSVSSLQKALDDNRFKLLFQPIISLRGQSDEHYEAFLRMMDSEGKEVSPYDFLPPAGPSEMASKIDRWVILQTIKNLGAHRSRGHSTRLFLNLTAETIQDATFMPWLSVALKAARLPGDSLIFQINESDAITYLKQAKDFAKGLKELHCKLSISRFGCAINPFNTLKHIDPAYIKLDGSFTEEIQKDDETKEHVKDMIKSLQEAGKLTIVPLVENAAVLSTLWQAGVNYIQGYYLQAPSTEMNYDFSEE